MSCSGCARRRAAIKAVVAGLVLWPLRALAHGAPGENPDAPIAEWYRGLRYDFFNKETKLQVSGSCCGDADCHTLASEHVRNTNGQYQIFWPPKAKPEYRTWMTVPDGAVLRIDNPAGRYVACVHYGVVLCFIPPTMS